MKSEFWIGELNYQPYIALNKSPNETTEVDANENKMDMKILKEPESLKGI